MKKIFPIIILILLFIAFPILGANTHSIDLESGSSQYLSIADVSQTGLDITGDMTIACAVRVESLPGQECR